MVTHNSNLFSISTGAADPIYRQLIDQIRRLVVSGQLAPGDVLPSVRDVAQHLALNPMTASKAYNMLETEGVLQRSRGVGMLVAEGRHQAKGVADRARLLRPTLERAAQETRQLELDPESAIALFKKILKEQS